MTNVSESIDSKTVVENFIEKLEQLDIDAALDMMSEDCVYKNMPFHTANGKDRIRRDLSAMMARVTNFEVEMIHIASDGEVVLTERIDTIETGRISAGIELMGVFVVRNGQITEWRDYFDWTSSGGRFMKSALSSLVNKLR